MTGTVHPEVPDFGAVRDAFGALEYTDAARWGKMDAPAMVEHVRRFNETYLGRVRVPAGTRFLARLLGGFFIRRYLKMSPFEMKRSMTTLPVLQVAPDLRSAAEFEATRRRLLRSFEEIEAISGEWDHPLYGKIPAETGKALARHHAAHHLRQFGRL